MFITGIGDDVWLRDEVAADDVAGGFVVGSVRTGVEADVLLYT